MTARRIYSQPTTHEELYGSGVTIADGDSARLSWTSSGGPDTLLDISTPTIPTVTTAGVYVVQATVKANETLTADAYFQLLLKLDGQGFNASSYTDSRPANPSLSPSGGQPLTSITVGWYFPAAARVELWVSNYDGASSRAYILDAAHIQRIA